MAQKKREEREAKEAAEKEAALAAAGNKSDSDNKKLVKDSMAVKNPQPGKRHFIRVWPT